VRGRGKREGEKSVSQLVGREDEKSFQVTIRLPGGGVGKGGELVSPEGEKKGGGGSEKKGGEKEKNLHGSRGKGSRSGRGEGWNQNQVIGEGTGWKKKTEKTTIGGVIPVGHETNRGPRNELNRWGRRVKKGSQAKIIHGMRIERHRNNNKRNEEKRGGKREKKK